MRLFSMAEKVVDWGCPYLSLSTLSELGQFAWLQYSASFAEVLQFGLEWLT